jgi:tetratricopeptide (TPR) repeat protein
MLGLGGLWVSRDKVKDFPGVPSLMCWVSQERLPRADPQRFAVALAHLEYDKDQQYERLIREALRDFEGVQLLQFDRTISLAKGQPEESEKTGHETARRYLSESGAHVLLWGLVLSQDGKNAPRLYWTTSRKEKRARGIYQPENFKLPDLFWSDLVDVLRLVVVNYGAEFYAGRGWFMADQLVPFIERVRRLLGANSGAVRWNVDARMDVQFVQATALLTLGEQTGTSKPIEEAVVAYHTILKEWTHDRVPLSWAMTQNNLGVALMKLGEWEGSMQRLEAAVSAYHSALQKGTRDQVPLDWAATQHNLGMALRILGEQGGGTQRLHDALKAYEAALQVRTRDRVPLDWAATQNDLGAALMRLGEQEGGTQRLHDALKAYEAALQVRTRDRVPLDWAATQHNLGMALEILGEREGDMQWFLAALRAYEAALQVRTRDRVPLDWAATQANLGTALKVLGEREGGTVRLDEAVAAFRGALEVLTIEWRPLDWAMTQHNLGNALVVLGMRKKDARLVCDALGNHFIAWEVLADRAPSHASRPVVSMNHDMEVLQKVFGEASWRLCLIEHEENVKRIGSLKHEASH